MNYAEIELRITCPVYAAPFTSRLIVAYGVNLPAFSTLSFEYYFIVSTITLVLKVVLCALWCNLNAVFVVSVGIQIYCK